MLDLVAHLGGPPPRAARPPFLIVEAETRAHLDAYRALRRSAFVDAQSLFARSDLDAADDHPCTRVLVALDPDGILAGGVRIHPAAGDGDLGWWQGGRLVAAGCAGATRGRVGAALVRAACARAVQEGALRFDAHVQARLEPFFGRLGWRRVRPVPVAGTPHVLMRFPVDRIARAAAEAKSALAGLWSDLLPHDAWRGDDGAPVPGSEIVACTDAITPAMVERDPEWAGWCGMLVTAHDLSAMGAAPLGVTDALGARDGAAAARVVAGLRRGSEAFGLPVLGGHTQLGVAASLSVTGLGRAAHPVPSGGGRPGHALTVTADVAGGWRPGYRARQWDSTSWRRHEDLRAMLAAVPTARPAAAKDVSMAGIAGTAGMLAEASGCGAEIDVARVPRPADVGVADWLTCFPGFAMVTADAPGAPPLPAGPAQGAECGRLVGAPGVRLVWPDGEVTEAIGGGVTGLGPCARRPHEERT